jgi:hypothetical protein
VRGGVEDGLRDLDRRLARDRTTGGLEVHVADDEVGVGDLVALSSSGNATTLDERVLDTAHIGTLGHARRLGSATTFPKSTSVRRVVLMGKIVHHVGSGQVVLGVERVVFRVERRKAPPANKDG